MAWTIKGENGANLDATERTLQELNIEKPRLILQSLGPDIFEWESASEDAAGTGTIIPSSGQLIEVFHNGVRRFRGHCTIPRIRSKSVHVTCEGPWWWMERIALTQEQEDGEETSAERASYVFPTQSLKTSIEALIDRAIENGVPIQRGTVDEIFAFPRITLAEMSIAQAFTDLMRICPDAVAFFDYTVTGLPTLNVRRRGEMTSEDLVMGTSTIEDIDVYPRLDLEVQRVTVDSVERNATTGKTQWATQSQGTATPGKNQIVVVSGPEVNDFLPEDKDNTVEVKSIAMPSGGTALGTLTPVSSHNASVITGDFKDFVLANDLNIANMSREFGTSFSSYLNVSNGGRYYVSAYSDGNLATAAQAHNLDKPNLISKDDPSGLYLVTTQTILPDWLLDENGITVVDANLVSFVRYTRNSLATEPDWWDEAINRAVRVMVGYPANTGGSAYQWNAIFESSIPVQLISVEYATLTTIYRQWAYDYIFPPNDLAAGLLSAQNWIPYEGRIQTVADEVDGSQVLGTKFNILNAHVDLSSMGALAKRISYDLHRARRTIDLGAPARVGFGTLASRFRRHPKDNIQYL